MRSAKVAAVLVLGATSSTVFAATKVLKFGKLVDGTGRVITNAVVIVEDDRVRSVASGSASIPSGAEVIDLSRYTGVPGLIDAHTHIAWYWDGVTTPRTEPPRHPAVTVVLAQENAQKALEAGVTTIRNLNAPDGTDLAMRDLINMGKMIGPRVFVSGLGIRITRSTTTPPAPIGIMADGVDGVIHAVRQVLASGADWVKMYGSTGGFDDVTGFQTFTFEEVKAAVDVTHALGKKIAVHCYGPACARDAIRAGVDSLEHATDMDDQTIAEMVRRKIYYVPTIDHNQYYVENAELYHFPPGAKEHLLDYIQRNFQTARKAFQAGARMVVGSDAVYNGWGLNMRELDWFVKMGMTPAQALEAATTEPAAMLGMEKSLGAVAPGFYADIVAVEGDPLADITAVSRRENVRWVMKAGRVVVDKTKSAEKTN